VGRLTVDGKTGREGKGGCRKGQITPNVSGAPGYWVFGMAKKDNFEGREKETGAVALIGAGRNEGTLGGSKKGGCQFGDGKATFV